MKDEWVKIKKIAIHSAKIGMGSCIAILLAEAMRLEFAPSAGIIAFLSTLNTKWATVKLARTRFITFIITVVLACPIFAFFRSDWVAFGMFMLLIAFISVYFGWRDTISVNAVAATHFLAAQDFSARMIANEFALVMIGMSTAILFNLIYDYSSQRKRIINDMKYVELTLKGIVEDMAGYLLRENTGECTVSALKKLDAFLTDALERANDYQDNTFVSHPGYYISYMEMRIKQSRILDNMLSELKKIREVPAEAEMVADYMNYMGGFILEHNVPVKQMDELNRLFDNMKAMPLPATHDEFAGRAVLYNILADLENYITQKFMFIDALNETEKAIYWKDRV